MTTPVPDAFVGDVGTEIRLKVTDQDGAAVDLSGASVLKIYLVKPDGTTLEKTATGGSTRNPSLTAANGYMHYLTIANDLNTAGNWFAEGYVEVASGKWTASPAWFLVMSVRRS